MTLNAVLTERYVLLVVAYLVGAVLLIPNRRCDLGWPDAEEWVAILWPLVIVALLVLAIVSLPFIVADKVRKLWRARRG